MGSLALLTLCATKKEQIQAQAVKMAAEMAVAHRAGQGRDIGPAVRPCVSLWTEAVLDGAGEAAGDGPMFV